MGRDLTFSGTAAPPVTAGGWIDGVPSSNADAARQRASRAAELGLTASGQTPFDWHKQPVGGRVASNPFEPRLLTEFITASTQKAQKVVLSSSRMPGQHSTNMHQIKEFSGAAGVSSSRATGANVHQGPRQQAPVAARVSADGSAGVATWKVGKEEHMFHSGPPGRRLIADEGTVRTKVWMGAAAMVEPVAS